MSGYVGVEPIPQANTIINQGTIAATTSSIFVPNGYNVGNIEVFLNGLRLKASDFTATDGVYVNFAQTLSAGTDYIIQDVRNYQQADVDSRIGNLNAQSRSVVARLADEAGFNLVDGSFEEGAVVSNASEVVLQESTGKTYGWFTDATVAVPANSTPETTGGVNASAWIDKTGLTLRVNLSDVNSTTIIAGQTASSISDVTKELTYTQDLSAEASTLKSNSNLIVGDKPLPLTASKRDSVQVSRNINGKTDCHAFADKTEIQSVTDSGTYGAFDSQVNVSHSGAQSHQFSFQDRAKYSGDGTLGAWGNIIWPEKTGAGTVAQRTDIEIKDVAGAGGVITSHIGLYIRDLVRASSNVAINLGQTTGYTLYASGGAPLYHKGDAGFGCLPTSGAPLNFSGSGATIGFASADDTNGAFVSVLGDKKTALWTNGAARLVCRESSLGYPVTPGSDNTQKLGNGSFRWAEIFTGNATINTSDGRKKQQVAALIDAERRVAARIKRSIVTFKFNDAVNTKGDAARIHVGVIAQEVRAAFEAEGLDPTRYSMFCFDEWDETSEEVETTADDPDAYTRVIEVQATEVRNISKRKIEVRGDKAVQIDYLESVEQPVYKALPVYNEDMTPVMYMLTPRDEETGADAVYQQETVMVPVMVKQERYYKCVTKPAGSLYGIRYEELMSFVIAAI